MKTRFYLPFLLSGLLILNCSEKEHASSRTLHYIFMDEHGDEFITKTGIEPTDASGTPVKINQKYGNAAFDFAANYGYIAGSTTGEVLKYDLNIMDPQPLYKDVAQDVDYLAIDPSRNRIYWHDDVRGGIFMGSLDGTLSPVPLFNGKRVATACTGMAVDQTANKLYFINYGTGTIYSADLTTPTIDPVLLWRNTNGAPNTLILSESRNELYWLDFFTNAILSLNISTGKTSTLLNEKNNDVQEPRRLFLLGSELYWYNLNGQLNKVDLHAPGKPTVIFNNTRQIVMGFGVEVR